MLGALVFSFSTGKCFLFPPGKAGVGMWESVGEYQHDKFGHMLLEFH